MFVVIVTGFPCLVGFYFIFIFIDLVIAESFIDSAWVYFRVKAGNFTWNSREGGVWRDTYRL